MIRTPFVRLLGLFCVIATLSNTVQAQGLLWSLPPDGHFVQFEGKFTQRDEQPETDAGNVTVEWLRQISIKSVGKEDALFNGKMVPCRWIEFKSVTGKQSEAGIDAGPNQEGVRIYKVLIPEHAIVGRVAQDGSVTDDDTIPISVIPIVRGVRKVAGNQPTPLRGRALQIYPMISMLLHYPKLETDGEEPALGTILTPAAAPLFQGGNSKKDNGRLVMESRTSRSTNTAQLWLSKDVPFGIAKWTITMVRETKETSDMRDAFAIASTVTIEMSVVAKGEEAFPELATTPASGN